MSVFDFTLQKELFQSANTRQLESLDDLVGLKGRIHANKEEVLEAINKNPDIGASKWWQSKFNQSIRKYYELKPMLGGIQELEEAVRFCEANNIDLAILEDDIADILIEERISHKDEDRSIEICHRESIRQTNIFKKIEKRRNTDIKKGSNQNDIWDQKFEPILRNSRKIDIFDPHMLQRYFEGGKQKGNGAKKLIAKLIETKGVTEINIFCYSIQLKDCSFAHVGDLKKALKELIKPKRKGIEVKFYMNTAYKFHDVGASASIRCENEVIICDHLSEMFDDPSGFTTRAKDFAVNEIKDYISTKTNLGKTGLSNLGDLKQNKDSKILGYIKFE